MGASPGISRKLQLSSTLAAVLLSTCFAHARTMSEDSSAVDPPDAVAREEGVAPIPDPPSQDAAEPAESPGQDLSGEDLPYWRKNLFRRFFKDQSFLFRTWFPSEIRNPAFSAPFLVTTVLAISSGRQEDGGPDARVTGDFSGDTRGSGQGAARFLSDLGDAAAGAVLIGTGYLAGRWSGHDRLAEASSLSAEAALSAGLWSSALKAVTARTRPSGHGTGDFANYDHSPGETVGSFPSGHATGAFAVATVFAGIYSDHRWVSWLAYGTAGLIGVSRVALNRHFPTDVVAGALLGNSMGRMVLARRRESEPRQSTFMPIVNPLDRQVGLVWSYSW